MIEPTFQIKTNQEKGNEGRFFLEPLEAGFGHTLGNALRRVLLTSLSGAAVTAVKISGVKHQFTTLPGLKEDVVELILNIKKLRIRMQVEGPVKLTLESAGPGPIKAAQIKTPAGVEVVNQDLVLGHLADKKAKLSCEMTVERGFGYWPFEERKSESLEVIPIDAIFSPVLRVNYVVETTRVGRVTNYDRLILEVATDGTMTPMSAVKEAAEVLIAYFRQIIEPKAVTKEEGKSKTSSDSLRMTIEELSLPTRIANALERAGYKTAGDLLNADKKELAKIKNLGEKSLKVIEAALVEKGIEVI